MSENDVMTYLTPKMLSFYYLTTMNNDFDLNLRWADLVSVAARLRPERRLPPLVRGRP